MKKLLVTIIIASLLSCNNPLSKVYTEEGFMLDMVEIRESNGQETVDKITTYVMQQAMKSAFDEDADNTLVGKTYEELLQQAIVLAEEMKAKEEEEKRLADEERLRIKNLQLKIAESVTFAVTKKGYYEGQYGYPKNITFSFSFKNKTNRDIAGIKGKLTFFDMFDEKITVINLSYDDGIRANKIAVYKAQIDYNDFESDDKKLRDTELTKLKHLWEPEQLIFSDGEKLAL